MDVKIGLKGSKSCLPEMLQVSPSGYSNYPDTSCIQDRPAVSLVASKVFEKINTVFGDKIILT